MDLWNLFGDTEEEPTPAYQLHPTPFGKTGIQQVDDQLSSIETARQPVIDRYSKLMQQVYEPDHLSGGQLAGQALVAFLPALLGRVFGGNKGGAMGAQAGLAGAQMAEQYRQASRADKVKKNLLLAESAKDEVGGYDKQGAVLQSAGIALNKQSQANEDLTTRQNALEDKRFEHAQTIKNMVGADTRAKIQAAKEARDSRGPKGASPEATQRAAIALRGELKKEAGGQALDDFMTAARSIEASLDDPTKYSSGLISASLVKMVQGSRITNEDIVLHTQPSYRQRAVEIMNRINGGQEVSFSKGDIQAVKGLFGALKSAHARAVVNAASGLRKSPSMLAPFGARGEEELTSATDPYLSYLQGSSSSASSAPTFDAGSATAEQIRAERLRLQAENDARGVPRGR